jgi:aminomethyltransferase
VDFWKAALEKGKEHGLEPAALGARDTLRLEMGFPLNGSDLNETNTPLEAGLKVFVSFDKPEDFPGRKLLEEQKEQGVKVRLRGLAMEGKSPPPRAHYAVYAGEEQVGELTSGTLSPSLKKGIGMTYLPVEHSKLGTVLEIDFRGRRFPAKIVKKPF